MRIVSTITTFLVLSFLGACTIPASNRAEWVCDGERLVAIFAAGPNAAATVEWRDRKWRLTKAPAASGARFISDNAEYWEHQDRLKWTVTGGDSTICERAG